MNELNLMNQNSKWKKCKLQDVCEINTGVRDPSRKPEDDFHYIDISGVNNVTKKILETKFIKGKDAPSRARKIVRTNDVIVSTTRPNLNAVAKIPSELDEQICSTGFCVLRAKPEIDPDFLFFFTQSQSFINSLSELVVGALYPAVKDSQVFSQEIYLPPLPEQQRIAQLLKTKLAAVERARQASEARLAAARELPAAYLREVFNSETAVAWQSTPIRDCCRVVNGTTPSTSVPDNWGGAIHWITPADLGKLKNADIQYSERTITEFGLKNTGLEIVPPGTVVLSSRAPIGHLGIARIPICTNQGCKSLIPSDRVDTEFLYFALRNSIGRLKDLGSGATFAEVSKTQVENFEILLPPLLEQQRIAQLLKTKFAAVEHMRQAVEMQRAAIQALPASLLRQAFSGAL
ncbi:type I restriction enzyme, S subunit [Allochromatium warmingii]|uniref:Type I restriction enzyme, S subunit n=1 Tax=Allochromatium warmingii TaxID=61595 RepID=A0A1H3EBS9_ALLWA|nr:restriction endonuclease subunit S [Allochromatium warmingii]SDX76212.1 type I restriction enzyme, S subunit [Allochromatium warmingii]